MSAFLDLTSNSILMKTDSLKSGKREISGAIVKRQQRKKEEVDDVNGSEDEGTPKKRRKKIDALPATPADAAKDTAEKFEYILRKGIEDAQKQNPKEVIVVLIDGGGPMRTVMEELKPPTRQKQENYLSEFRPMATRTLELEIVGKLNYSAREREVRPG